MKEGCQHSEDGESTAQGATSALGYPTPMQLRPAKPKGDAKHQTVHHLGDEIFEFEFKKPDGLKKEWGMPSPI